MVLSEEKLVALNDTHSIYVRKWIPSEVRGTIQIAHGMAEHSGSYLEFINVLVTNGFAVFIHDHRGHGKTAQTPEDLGHFEPDTGWGNAVDDIISLSEIIRKEVNAPLFLLGHSMGSFLSRRAVQLRGDLYDGLIISGTGTSPGILGKIGEMVATVEMKRTGEKTRSKLLDKLSFGTFNSKFKPTKTPFDWLSSDEGQVQHYIMDEFCGFVCTTSFYRELFRGLAQINKEDECRMTPSKLPIFLFSGDKDPVGDMGKGVQKAHNLYKKCGVEDVTLKLYANGRHEMLHEVNRQDVFQDVIDWVNKYI